MITIIDYKAGNLRSVANKLERIGVKTIITDKVAVISKAEKIILPGVGNFKTGMENLKKAGLIAILETKVLKEKVPILGVCLGLQLFSESSEEGHCRGLGWIKAETKKFDFSEKEKLKIPHMGWNNLKIKRKSLLLDKITEDDDFYFVHSYHVCPKNPKIVLATTHYGYDFCSVINQENIYGTQFHPEKSHAAGMQILKNFALKC